MCLLSLSRDSTLPKLTSNTKQQLLFYGCVQAEPGHLHWATGLLAVFVVSSKVCIFSYTLSINPLLEQISLNCCQISTFKMSECQRRLFQRSGALF